MRHSLLMEHEGALRKMRQEAEDQLVRAERERDELHDELRSLQHDRDQSLLQAETEKQQVWSWCMMYEEGLNHSASDENKLVLFKKREK